MSALQDKLRELRADLMKEAGGRPIPGWDDNLFWECLRLSEEGQQGEGSLGPLRKGDKVRTIFGICEFQHYQIDPVMGLCAWVRDGKGANWYVNPPPDKQEGGRPLTEPSAGPSAVSPHRNAEDAAPVPVAKRTRRTMCKQWPNCTCIMRGEMVNGFCGGLPT